MPISLVLADDHGLILRGLEYLFSTSPDFAILASCINGEQALTAVRHHRPDILLLDLKMPVLDGLGVMRKLREEHDIPTKIVLLTAELNRDEALESMRLGVRGILLKHMAPALLIQCIRKVYAGEEWFEKRSVSRALDRLLCRGLDAKPELASLTPREIELVRQVASGISNREIADQLHISLGTVKIHLHNVYGKLGVRGRVALANYARENGLI